VVEAEVSEVWWSGVEPIRQHRSPPTAAKIQPPPFSFSRARENFGETKSRSIISPNCPREPLPSNTRTPGERRIDQAFSFKLPKEGSFGEEKLFCSSSAAASSQQIGRTPLLSSHERLSAPASSECSPASLMSNSERCLIDKRTLSASKLPLSPLRLIAIGS
jgi:hypothetical protein